MAIPTPSLHQFFLTRVVHLSSFLKHHSAHEILTMWKLFLLNGSWKSLYWNTDPFIFAFCFALLLSICCFIVQNAAKNISQVDKLWNILPCIFVWHFNAHAWGDIRLLVMGILTTLWSIGLTYQFFRKGGYKWPPWQGEEDYRWEYVKSFPLLRGRVAWFLFSFLFIDVFQLLLLLGLSFPSYACYIYMFNYRRTSSFDFEQLNSLDFALIVLFLFFLSVRTKADQEMWQFQSKKYQLLKTRKKLEGVFAQGFLDRGLFSLCRHPNFLAEQAMWLCFYLFSVSCTFEVINYTTDLPAYLVVLVRMGKYIDITFLLGSICLNLSLTGFILLVALFWGSTATTEFLSASKYPEFSKYQKRVHCIIPKLHDWPKLFFGLFLKSSVV